MTFLLRGWMTSLLGGFALVSALFLSMQALAQEVPETAQHKIVTNSNLVVLPVTVKDRNGNLVAGLTATDFRVFEDGIEQDIDVFSAENTPLSIVVLVDDDLKPANAHEMASSLRSMLAGISAADEAMVCRFDLEFYPCDGFTSDSDRLLAELKDAQEASKERPPIFVPWQSTPSWHVRSTGEPPIAAATDLGSAPTKALDDAVYAAAKFLNSRGRERRKVILIVSDGINGLEFNKHSYEETIADLLAGNISVFSVAVGSTAYHKKFARLRDYANQSGGDIFYARDERTMEQLYSRVTEQARHEYTLAYEPDSNAPQAKYHRVTVTVAREGVQVKTREGYYERNDGSIIK